MRSLSTALETESNFSEADSFRGIPEFEDNAVDPDNRYEVQSIRMGDDKVIDRFTFRPSTIYALSIMERNQWSEWWPMIQDSKLFEGMPVRGTTFKTQYRSETKQVLRKGTLIVPAVMFNGRILDGNLR